MKIINNNEEIDALINNNDIALIYFSGQNCGVCSVIKSKVKSILQKYDKIASGEIETEKSVQISAQFNIFTIPAILLYVDKKETIREARYISMEQLEEKIDRYYNLIYN